jgi:pimeloyl-ACP methyl ester carboxylesterase
MIAASDMTELIPGRAAGISFLRRPGRADAQTMVLLHGIGSNAQSFEPLMAALPPSIDALAWNAPGYADSTPLSGDSPVPADYANVLKTFLDALDVRQATIVGHSLGCLFAASFAALYPRQALALALLSPALGYRVPTGASLPPNVQARIDEINAMGPVVFAAKRAARLIGDPHRKPWLLDAVQRAMAAVHPSGYVQAVHALGAGDLLADIASVSSPALVAVGTKDVITPPDNARNAQAAFKNGAAYHEIDGAGHALPQEEPEATSELLARLARK